MSWAENCCGNPSDGLFDSLLFMFAMSAFFGLYCIGASYFYLLYEHIFSRLLFCGFMFVYLLFFILLTILFL